MAKSAIQIYLKSAIESGFDFIKRRFDSVEELNRNFHAQRKWILTKLEKKADFKRRLAKVLEVLKMHSCKYIGISFMTENNLCGAYEAQFGESISKRTVSTCMKHLKEMGFVTIMAAKREDGKQTSNIVVIERFAAAAREEIFAGRSGGGKKGSAEPHFHYIGERKEPESPANDEEERIENVAYKEPENLHTKKTTSLFKNPPKEHKERIAKERRLLNFVPKWFKDRIACCSTQGRAVYEYWKVAKHLMGRTFGPAIAAKDVQEVVGRAVREFFLSAKEAARGKFRMSNPFGFFHAVLEAEGYAHVRREVQTSSPLFYNWLED